MIVTSKIVDGAAVGTGVLFTSPVNQKTLIKKLTFTNTSAGAITLSVYLVAALGALADANAVRKLKTLAPNETFECFEAENQVLLPGEMLSAATSSGGIVCHSTGLLIT